MFVIATYGSSTVSLYYPIGTVHHQRRDVVSTLKRKQTQS